MTTEKISIICVETGRGPAIDIMGVQCDTLLQRADGQKIEIYMRDDTIEITVAGKDLVYTVDMQTGKMKLLKVTK